MEGAQAMNEDILNLRLANSRLRTMNERLIEEQKGLIGALAVGIEQAKRYPDDGLLKTFIGCAERHIATALKVP